MATDTIVIPGNGTGTLSVQLHGPDITDVEAVLAEIDTSGAGDTVATLTATSPTGNDVAAVPQGAPVSGGGQGRATWALRLAEDAAGGTLETTDGSTTIAPTKELFIGSGLELAGGGGVATVFALAGSEWCHGTWPGLTANTDSSGNIFPVLTIDAGNGTFAISGNHIIVPEAGWYLVGIDDATLSFGPRALSVPLFAQQFGPQLADLSHPTQFVQCTIPLQVALGVNDRLISQTSAVKLLLLGTGDALEVLIYNGPGAGNKTGTLGGRFWLTRML